MGGKLGQCRCTEQHTPTGYVCETCGGMEYREAHVSALPSPEASNVSREPISAELLKEILEEYGVRSGECRTCDQLKGRHLDYCLIPKIEDAYARAAARTCETKEK